MFSSQPFYNETIKRTTAVFGTLFNNIMIETKESSSSGGGVIIKRMKVPLAYGPKEKFLARIEQEPNFSDDKQKIAMTLPRMAFMMTDISYYSDIQTSMYARQIHSSNIESRNTTSSGVPYQMNFDLYVLTKNQTEAFQIIEQIIPYFRPNFVVSIKQLDGQDSVWDMPISLTGIQPDVQYEGAFEERRTVLHTLSFSVISKFFEPVSEQGVIKKVICRINNQATNSPIETVTVEAITGSPNDDDEYEIQTTIVNDFFDD